MFQPEPVERDERGMWLHSVLRRSEEEDITKLPEAEGMEFRFVDFEISQGPQAERVTKV